MKKTIKYILLFSLMLSLFVTNNAFVVGATEDNSSLLSGYGLVTQTKKLTMYADENGSFAIKNNASGYVWYSHPTDITKDKKTVGVNKRNFQSEVIVYYVYKDENSESSSYAEASVNSQSLIANNNIKTKKIKNGLKVEYDFYNISARITISYTISGDTFKARVIGKETLEQDKFRKAVKGKLTKEQKDLMIDSYITSIWLLPTFGAGNSNQNGFVFVPDGCGAYMNYEPLNHATEITNIPVYGSELSIDEYGVPNDENDAIIRERKAYMPIFAIANGNDGMMAVIDKGEENASVNAYKAGTSNSYTGISSQLDLRKITYSVIGGRKVQGVAESFKTIPDFQLTYYFLSNENIGISDFAEILRDKWEEQGYLKKQSFSPALSLQINGAARVDSNFLGFPTKKIEPLTTLKQAKSIVSELKENSVKNIAVNYIGWQGSGLQNSTIIDKASIIKSLGSNKDLSSLLNACDELYLDTDLITFTKSGNGITKNKNATKTAFNKPAVVRNFSYAKYTYEKEGYYLLTPGKLFGIFEKYIKSFNKLPENIGISFNKMSECCYSDFGKNAVSRIETVSEYKKCFEKTSRNISASDANFYAWSYAERIFNAPNSSSREKIYDGEIPFYHIVLHGYCAITSPFLNQSSVKNDAFLRAVETGSEISYNLMYVDSGIVNGTDFDYLYGTTFSMHKDDILEFYGKYSKLLNKISSRKIIDYISINKSVSKTVYDNGITVFVNYGDTDYIYDDITVKAHSFGYSEEA